jgi:Mg2+-importing ATPase
MLVLVLIVFAVNVFFRKPVLDSLLFSVALAVGLTPQLLPAIISINLSKGSQRMAAGGVLVRRLESIENFGSMDVLCTDKTGTLTEGVVQLDGALDVGGQPSDQVFQCAYLNAKLQTGLANPLDEAILAQPALDIADVAKVDFDRFSGDGPRRRQRGSGAGRASAPLGYALHSQLYGHLWPGELCL